MTRTENELANDKYHDKVLSSSAWINQEFLEGVLKKSFGEKTKYLDHKVRAAVGVGDNFLSILYKTKVDYTNETEDNNKQQRTSYLMIKGVPTAKIMLEMIEEMGVFRKEIKMYNECLPAMLKYCKEYFPEDSAFVAPYNYPCNRENTLVMEDLGENGYKMANRQEQLDFEHCAITLKTLARFHALSAKIFESNPGAIKELNVGEFFTEANEEKMSPFIEQCFRALSNEVDKWGGREETASGLRQVGQKFWAKVIHLIRASDSFNVLNHGDMWVNNIMYKYNVDGTIHSAKLVDFQLSRYSTPALDLLYFFFSSPQAEVLCAKMPELLRIYHDALTNDLSTLNLNVKYSFEDLEEDVRDRCGFGLMVIAQILPIIMAKPTDCLDLDSFDFEEVKNLKDDETPMLKNFRYSGYRIIAGLFLEHFEKLGFMEEALKRLNPIELAAVAREEQKKILEENRSEDIQS